MFTLNVRLPFPRLSKLPRLQVPYDLAPLVVAALVVFAASVVALIRVLDCGWIPKELS